MGSVFFCICRSSECVFRKSLVGTCQQFTRYITRIPRLILLKSLVLYIDAWRIVVNGFVLLKERKNVEQLLDVKLSWDDKYITIICFTVVNRDCTIGRLFLKLPRNVWCTVHLTLIYSKVAGSSLEDWIQAPIIVTMGVISRHNVCQRLMTGPSLHLDKHFSNMRRWEMTVYDHRPRRLT